jgi:hypothetical protein
VLVLGLAAEQLAVLARGPQLVVAGDPHELAEAGAEDGEDGAQVVAGLAEVAAEDQPVVGARGDVGERGAVDRVADVEVAEGEQLHGVRGLQEPAITRLSKLDARLPAAEGEVLLAGAEQRSGGR